MPVLVLVLPLVDRGSHPVGAQWTELLHRVYTASSLRLLALVLVHVAHFIVKDILVEQVRLLHDRVAHRDVRVVQGHAEKVTIVCKEINSFLEGID